MSSWYALPDQVKESWVYCSSISSPAMTTFTTQYQWYHITSNHNNRGAYLFSQHRSLMLAVSGNGLCRRAIDGRPRRCVICQLEWRHSFLAKQTVRVSLGVYEVITSVNVVVNKQSCYEPRHAMCACRSSARGA